MKSWLVAVDPTPAPTGIADPLSQIPGNLPVWGISILGFLFIILTATDNLGKLLGKFGRIQEERVANSRRASVEQDDADLKELRRQVNNLQEMLADEQRQTKNYRLLVVELYRYILAAQHDPANLQNPVPQPPEVEETYTTTATQGE